MNEIHSVIICARHSSDVSEDSWLMVNHKERGWELPGGKFNPNEMSSDAAKRELEEETGLVGNICEYTETLVEGCSVYLINIGQKESLEWKSNDKAIDSVKWHNQIPDNLAWPKSELISILEYFGIHYSSN